MIGLSETNLLARARLEAVLQHYGGYPINPKLLAEIERRGLTFNIKGYV